MGFTTLGKSMLVFASLSFTTIGESILSDVLGLLQTSRYSSAERIKNNIDNEMKCLFFSRLLATLYSFCSVFFKLKLYTILGFLVNFIFDMVSFDIS
jgi:hypothetical protein